MNPLYNLGIRLYAAGVRIASLRNRKARLLIQGQRQSPAAVAAAKAGGGEARWVWVHAASLGEFEQGRPLIERIRSERPELKVLLTFFSPSGYEVRRNYPGADAVCYLPFDTPRAARRFVEAVRPVAAVFVKYEFWGNYLEALHAAGVPTYIISAIFRPGQPFFKPWGGMFRRMLRMFTRIFVQDEASRRLLAGIGIDNVTVAGDTRFDRVTDIVRSMPPMPLIDDFASGADDMIVAGSSWPADEDLLIPWLHDHPEVKSIFAPHEFDPARLEALRRRLGAGSTRLLSEIEAHPGEVAAARHIIVDSFGKLAAIYGKATLAYVGGGFGVGIHNLNEAAVHGIPVVFGPRHGKFKEAADLIACGGGFAVDSAAGLNHALSLLPGPEGRPARTRAGEAAGAYIKHSIGATDLIFNQIFSPSKQQ